MSGGGAVLVLGGRSDIGLAVAHAFAARGHSVQLAARDPASLDPEKRDIELRHHVTVTLHEFDALAVETHEGFVGALPEIPAIAVCAVGLLGDDQADLERDPAAARAVMRTNYEGPANVLGILANRFEARGSGTLIGISSVAGDRGRATNYIYGSAKAGFTAYLSGLRNRLAGKGVHVLTVLPGFVATKMTEGKDLSPRLTTDPVTLAEAVVRASDSGRNILYYKRIWALVMLVIRNIPEAVFKRTRI